MVKGIFSTAPPREKTTPRTAAAIAAAAVILTAHETRDVRGLFLICARKSRRCIESCSSEGPSPKAAAIFAPSSSKVLISEDMIHFLD